MDLKLFYKTTYVVNTAVFLVIIAMSVNQKILKKIKKSRQKFTNHAGLILFLTRIINFSLKRKQNKNEKHYQHKFQDKKVWKGLMLRINILTWCVWRFKNKKWFKKKKRRNVVFEFERFIRKDFFCLCMKFFSWGTFLFISVFEENWWFV